MLFIVDGTRFG